MSALADLIDERVSIARLHAGKAAREARAATGSVDAQAAADQALADLDYYLNLQERIGPDRSGPYRPANTRSFFGDVVAEEKSPDARRTLDSYRDEIRSTVDAFGGLVVPQYLIDELENSGHSGSPLVDLLRRQLPGKGMTIDIPNVTTGITSEDQTAENTAGTPSDPATSEETLDVHTIYASMTLPFAALDRMSEGLDQLVAREAVVSLQALEERRVIAGTGTSGQPFGILEAGAGTVTMAGTAAVDLLDAVSEAAANIDAARETPAGVVVMAPRRWRWLLAHAGTYTAAIQPVTAGGPVVGKLLGMDVVSSGGVPVNLGTSTNEDRVIVLRRNDVTVADTPIRVTKLRDGASLAANLTAKVQVDRYYTSAVTSTAGVQVVVGAGMVNPY